MSRDNVEELRSDSPDKSNPGVSASDICGSSTLKAGDASLEADIDDVVSPSQHFNEFVFADVNCKVTGMPSPEDIQVGQKRRKREEKAERMHSNLHSAARTLGLSLGKVVRNASDLVLKQQAMRILGVSESGESLDESLYKCAFAQFNLAKLNAQSKQSTTEVNAIEKLDKIPGGSPMDVELEALAKEARCNEGRVDVSVSALKDPEYDHLLAIAQPREGEFC